MSEITKPQNPRAWRQLLADTVGSRWTFGNDPIYNAEGARTGTVEAYFSAPMNPTEAEKVAAKLAGFGISPIVRDMNRGQRIEVTEPELFQHGAALVAAANQRQVG